MPKGVAQSRTMDPKKEKLVKTLAKYAKIAGYVTAALLAGIAIYWLMIPGGWIVSIGFAIAAAWVAIESKRAIKS